MQHSRKRFCYVALAIALVTIVVGITVTQKFGIKKIWTQKNSALTPPPGIDDKKPNVPVARGYHRLRATHYFADTYPKNFWNSFEPADVARDFKQIKADGFNAIVLVLPWAEFQPVLSSNGYDEKMFDRLKMLMDAATAHELGVVLRLSYVWSYRPDAENSIFNRMHGVFHDEAMRQTWLKHLAKIHTHVVKHPAFRLAFLSWEDLYPMAITSMTPNLSDQNMLRMYREYLSRTSTLSDISTLYGKTISSWDALPFPDRKSPAYAKVLDYWDDALLNRLFIPANQNFPNLSLEVRSDWDPVWEKDGKTTWKNHALTYALPGTDTLTSYYAIAWGMKNEGDFVSAADAIKGFDRFVAHLAAEKNHQHLFLDQFLFYYELEEFKRNTQIKPEERDIFLQAVAQRFRELDISYALWYYRDYVDNAVYNAHFSLGLEGWRASEGVKVSKLADGHYAALLDKGNEVSQKIPVQQRSAWKGGNEPLNVCITPGPGDNRRLELVTGDQAVTMTWRKGEKRQCVKVKRGAELVLTIKANTDALAIDLVELFTVLEPSAVYDRDLKVGAQRDAIRKLNAMVSEQK